MQPLSVVIVCKNEEAIIGRTLQSLGGLTDDIVVFDNGSTDNTIDIVKRSGASLQQGAWEGFGKTKQKASSLAKYDWVLSLDADEAIDEELKRSLLALSLTDEKVVYDLKFRNYLGDKRLRFGEWGTDRHSRLFNRKWVNWDDAPVHEKLVVPRHISIRSLNGYVLHHTVNNIKEYALKITAYAMLNAEKYHLQGRKASWWRMRLSPGFSFIKYYIFKLGFLDGQAGYICAKMTAFYTFLKYTRLRELNRQVASGK